MISKISSNHKIQVGLILGFAFFVLLLNIDTLSISYKEALNLYVNSSLLSYFTKLSTAFFGFNDYALRLPFLVFYILSGILMYATTQNYFRYEKDRIINLVLFLSLPGVMSASLLVNSSIVVLFFVLYYVYLFQKNKKHNEYLLVFCLFIDSSFAIVYLALFFWSLKYKDTRLMLVSLALFTISMYIFGFDTGGKPENYFLDTFGTYATIFSPLLFLFLIYTIYRISINKEEKSLIYYISATALFISFLFSFRQKILIEDFAPLVVISLPLMLRIFLNSYRVRLKEFRKRYDIFIFLVLFMLFINIFFTFYNKILYNYIPNPQKHLVYKHHIAKDLAKLLQEKKINNIKTNKQMQLRLKFYGINKGEDYILSKTKIYNANEVLEIKYFNRTIDTYYLKKLIYEK
jgi:hypothetical protein